MPSQNLCNCCRETVKYPETIAAWECIIYMFQEISQSQVFKDWFLIFPYVKDKCFHAICSEPKNNQSHQSLVFSEAKHLKSIQTCSASIFRNPDSRPLWSHFLASRPPQSTSTAPQNQAPPADRRAWPLTRSASPASAATTRRPGWMRGGANHPATRNGFGSNGNKSRTFSGIYV